jgi:tetratricopeptide (TPR) repeat protein
MLRTARGEVLRKLGRTEEALEWMKITVTGLGASSTDWLELAEIERELGSGGWRERLASARKMDPQNPLPLVREGDWLTEDGVYKEAEAVYQRALAIDERCVEAWIGLGHLKHQLGRNTEAEADLRRGLAADPLFADGWFNLAVVVEALRGPEQARDHYRKTLSLEPTHLRAMVNLGISLVAAGEYAEAEPMIQEARALDPEEGRATYSLALLWMRTERAGQAELLLLEHLAGDPDVPELRRLLVFVVEAQGDAVRAGQLAQEVLIKAPNDYWMTVLAVEGLVAAGDRGRALSVLSAARAKGNPELEKLVSGRRVLRELVK